MPYPTNDLLFFEPRLGPLFTYYALGNRALEWALLMEHLVLTRIFLADFLKNITHLPKAEYNCQGHQQLLAILKFLSSSIDIIKIFCNKYIIKYK